MSNLQQLKQQAKQAAADARKAAKDAEEAQKDIEARELHAKSSALRVVQVIRDAIKLWIKQGVLTRGQAIVYFDKYLEVFGKYNTEVEYLRIATTMLSHPYYGVESTTKGFWNGGLMFKGKTYENTQLLYDTLTELLGGDPFDTIEWFNELLGWVLDDPIKMAADAYLGGDNFSAYANYCRRVVKAAKEPIKIPDISEFTGEDAAFLATFLGVF